MNHRKTIQSDVWLVRKIALVLTIKVCFIVAIRQIWFSEPAAEHMRLPIDTVEQRLLGTSKNMNMENTDASN